jgi:hypothetical protein
MDCALARRARAALAKGWTAPGSSGVSIAGSNIHLFSSREKHKPIQDSAADCNSDCGRSRLERNSTFSHRATPAGQGGTPRTKRKGDREFPLTCVEGQQAEHGHQMIHREVPLS